MYFDAHQGTPLLALIRRANLPLGLACGARGVCLACKVRVAGPMLPPGVTEAALLTQITEPGPWRIACLARVAGPVEVTADYW